MINPFGENMGDADTDKVGLEAVYRVITQRLATGNPEESYVARLAAQGPDAALKKIGEECTVVLLAAKGDDTQAMVHEIADLLFHLLVWMAQAGISPGDVEGELARRFGRSGLADTD